MAKAQGIGSVVLFQFLIGSLQTFMSSLGQTKEIGFNSL